MFQSVCFDSFFEFAAMTVLLETEASSLLALSISADTKRVCLHCFPCGGRDADIRNADRGKRPCILVLFRLHPCRRQRGFASSESTGCRNDPILLKCLFEVDFKKLVHVTEFGHSMKPRVRCRDARGQRPYGAG